MPKSIAAVLFQPESRPSPDSMPRRQIEDKAVLNAGIGANAHAVEY